MHPNRKKYLKNWLTAALCLELFPTGDVDQVRKVAGAILEAVHIATTRENSTAVELYQLAFHEKGVLTALAQARVLQNIPPEWMDATMARLMDFGPLLYVQDTLYWMVSLEYHVRLRALRQPELAGNLERIQHAIVQAKRNGITVPELEELKTSVYDAWAQAK